MEQKIKTLIKTAMQQHDETAKNILRLSLAEIQREQNNAKNASLELTEDQKVAVLKRLLKSNRITMEAIKENDPDNATLSTLEKETEIIESLLPKSITQEQLAEFIKANNIDLTSFKSDGQAIGAIIKEAKKASFPVEADVVRTFICSNKQ